MGMLALPGKALILVENLSVPFDRRVWQESTALRDAGWDVSVICPMGTKQDTESFVNLDGIAVHRYPLVSAIGGPLGYLREYGSALWHTYRLARAIGPVDVIHACNPPDLFFLLTLLPRWKNVRFVFDQHDLVPELYLSRFNRGRDLLYRAVCWLEQRTYRAAEVVISTNASYRDIAITRGHKRPEQVFVVRSAPAVERFRDVPAEPSLKGGKQHLLCYLGVMGPQDGVDYALRSLALLRDEIGRSDWRAVLIGGGDAFDRMVALAHELGLSDLVEFTGRIPDADLLRYLSTADVCLAPDPLNPLNDVSTMNKIMEYMAMGCPIVSFDLKEARVSAGEAAVYAKANEESQFAALISQLLDDPAQRERMGAVGRERVSGPLSWSRSAASLIAAYTAAASRAETSGPASITLGVPPGGDASVCAHSGTDPSCPPIEREHSQVAQRIQHPNPPPDHQPGQTGEGRPAPGDGPPEPSQLPVTSPDSNPPRQVGANAPSGAD